MCRLPYRALRTAADAPAAAVPMHLSLVILTAARRYPSTRLAFSVGRFRGQPGTPFAVATRDCWQFGTLFAVKRSRSNIVGKAVICSGRTEILIVAVLGILSLHGPEAGLWLVAETLDLSPASESLPSIRAEASAESEATTTSPKRSRALRLTPIPVSCHVTGVGRKWADSPPQRSRSRNLLLMLARWLC
jgi:hypothetical protein